MYQASEDGVKSYRIAWNQFKKTLKDIDDLFLQSNIDNLVESPVISVGQSNLKGAAVAGITLETTNNSIKSLITQFKKNYSDPSWFSSNPAHPLSQVHKLIMDEFNSDMAKSHKFSFDKVYGVLKRSPFGFKPVVMTAFVLGFCMKELIGKNYQWTDGRMSGDLDPDNLGQIIESALKCGPGIPAKNKKEICRLTEEDQAFINDAPKMFGADGIAHSIKDALSLITHNLEKVSNRVPIWVLPDFIRKNNDPDADVIASVIKDISVAASISAKGDQETRSNAIRDIGRKLIDDQGLSDKVVKYIESRFFMDAFADYIKDKYPAMENVAEEAEDYNRYYIHSIINKMADTASFLWKEQNLDENVNQVIAEYRLVKVVEQLGSKSFVDFKESLKYLEDGIDRSLVPLSIVCKSYPRINDVIEGINQLKKPMSSGAMDVVVKKIEDDADDLRKLFFDYLYDEAVSIVRKCYEPKDIQDDDLRSILKSIVQKNPDEKVSKMSEDEFSKSWDSEIERYHINSSRTKIGNIWKRKTSTSSFSEWENKNNMPAKYAFPDMPHEVFEKITNPDQYNEIALEKAIDDFDGQDPPSFERSRKRFMDDMVPGPYRGIVEFPEIVQYLKQQDANPSKWHNIDLKPLLSREYSVNVVPNVKERINGMDPVDFKKAILEAIENNENLGIEIIKAIR